MALITRISRLFKADFHAVIDQMEEPDIVLRQAVREMEEAVNNRADSITKMAAESDSLGLKLEELKNSLLQTEEELDICFASGEEALSKTLVKRKLGCEKQAIQLTTRRTQLDKNLHQAKTQQHECQTILESMQQKAALLAEDKGEQRFSEPTEHDVIITEADIEIAYLKEKQKRSLS